MRLDDERESSNFEDQRGQGGGFGFGGGGGGLGGGLIGFLLPMILSRFGIGGVIILGLGYLLLSSLGGGGVGSPRAGFSPAASQVAGAPSGMESSTDKFVRRVLATTEDTWGEIFKEGGATYQDPRLVVFTGQTRSGCGVAQTAAGPFYCPADHKVYLDTAFFDELARRFGAPGDFARAYVIAHEIGHHVQNQLGLFDKIKPLQDRAGTAGANAIQVKVELQADCYAGVWAAKNRDILDAGDFEQGVKAAGAIGDDTLQRQSQGTVVPDSFTHGTSAQRVKWLTTGFQAGSPDACDTFAAGADA